MQTPIDFGKTFLNSFFSMRDPDRCLEDLAYDVVWITPKQMYHFLTAMELRKFLQEEMAARPERYYVDIVSIKSSPSATDISTVAYEVNLVPKEEDKAVYLRCSMAICKRGQHFEITFLHMSEKQGQGGMDQIKEFTENLPCGVLIFAYMGKEGLKTLFYNEYFWKKLHYREDQFRKQMERDPFFMAQEEERDKILERLKEVQGTGGHLAANVTFYRKDGNRFQYRMVGAPAYQEGDNTVYYCVFQETTGFHQLHTRMQERIASASEILAKIPASLCVLTGDAGNWHPVYVSRQFPERFGMTMAGFAEAVAKDPFYGLEMTSITRDRLTEVHLQLLSKDPYLGVFEMVQKDGSKRWTDVYLINSADHNGNRLRMLFYVDKDDEKRDIDQQIAKAENASRQQQERAKAEVKEAQEKAKQQVEEAQTTVRKEIEEAQAKTQEQIESFRGKMNQVLESQKGSIEIKEKQIRMEYEAKEQELQKAFAEKERMLEKQLENYKKTQEAELANQKRTVDILLSERDKELEKKQSEIDRLEKELSRTLDSLRDSENLREQLKRSSELREKEQEKAARRLQEMIETIQRTGGAAASAARPAEAVFTAEQDADAWPGAEEVYAQPETAMDPVRSIEEDEPLRTRGTAGDVREIGADSWMDGMEEYSSGEIMRKGAVNEESMKPFAAGIRPVAPARTASTAAGTDRASRPGSPSRIGSAAISAGSQSRVGRMTTGTGGTSRMGTTAGAGSTSRMGGMTAGASRKGGAVQSAPAEPEKARSSVMDDLVQMASADDGVIRKELFSLDECLENVMMLQEPVCDAKKIRMELKKSASMPPQAIGDKSKLQRALVSLLESAIEQTPIGGEISLACRADRASGNRVYLYFIIRDNGSNIASDLMQGMFDKRDEKDDPLRAGLYIAREIVSMMGGNVRVRSRRGEGTEFMVTVCMNLP